MSEFSLDYSKYRVPEDGSFALADIDPGDTQGLVKEQDKPETEKQLTQFRKRLDELQQRLYAESKQSLLLVLQAMDTAGKDSTIRHVMAPLNPQGCRVTNFKSPNSAEQARDFLWRIHSHAPRKGSIGVFNRSHYEDVLIVRVYGWAPADLIEKRYGHINDFEKMLTDHGTRIVKVMLHISKDYQLKRLKRRLHRPDKHWKFVPDDLRDRERWMTMWKPIIRCCVVAQLPMRPGMSSPPKTAGSATWWICRLLVDTLEDMNPRFPEPAFDPADYPPEAIT